MLLILVLGLVASVLLYASRVVPWDTALLGLAIIWTAALPGILYLQGIGRGPVPFFPAVGVFYIVFFGLPVFTLPFGYTGADNIILYNRVILTFVKPEVLALVLLSIGAMVGAFYMSRAFLFNRLRAFRFANEAQAPAINILLAGLIVSHVAFQYLPVLRQVPSLGQLLGPAGFLGFGGYYLLWARGQTYRLDAAAIFFILLPLEIFSRVRVFFLTDIILLAVFFIFLFWREGRMKILAGLTGFILIVLLAYTASTNLRSLSNDTAEKFKIVGKGFVENLLHGKITDPEIDVENTYADGRFAPLVKRMSHIWIFHWVYDQSPTPIPYWDGFSYRPLITSFVPRVLYPDKPREVSGHTFGQRYGLLSNSSSTTSVNIPWLTELLANFGPWGAVLGMFLVGVFLAFLDTLFNRRGMSDLEFVIGLTLIFPLVYPESNISVMTGSLLPLFIALFAYFYVGSKTLRKLRV